MTPQQIRDAITNTPALQALVPDTEALAAALPAHVPREVYSRLVSARGMAAEYAGGPVAAEVILMALESAAATRKASADAQDRVLGSLIARQLGFLAGDGLDFGSPALRGMLDQFAALQILTAEQVSGLKAIATRPVTVTELEVRRAIYADDGTLRV